MGDGDSRGPSENENFDTNTPGLNNAVQDKPAESLRNAEFSPVSSSSGSEPKPADPDPVSGGTAIPVSTGSSAMPSLSAEPPADSSSDNANNNDATSPVPPASPATTVEPSSPGPSEAVRAEIARTQQHTQQNSTETPSAAPKPQLHQGEVHKSGLLRTVLEILLVVAVAGLVFWGLDLQSKNADLNTQLKAANAKVADLNNNPAIVAQRQTEEAVDRVSTLTEVPKNETPQLLIVTDPAALKKQYAFFAPAEKDDQILMYVQAGKVIVYRPSTNKVILNGPLTITQTQTTTPAKR